MEIALLIVLIGSLSVLIHTRKRNSWLVRKNFVLSKKLKAANRKLEAWQLGWDLEKQRFLEALADAFLLVNMQGQVLAANKKARLLFGNKGLEGCLLSECDYNETLAGEVQKALASEHGYTSTFSLSSHDIPSLEKETGKGGSWWLIDAAPVIGVDGCRRLLIRDITDQYRTAQVRKDFVANASHELRTPLTIIVGYLESLEEEAFIDSSYEMGIKIVRIMRKHALRLQRIVEDMLMISKLESNENNILKERWFDLNKCVVDVYNRLESIFEKKQARLECQFPAGTLEIYGDKFYWIQILFNLIENALKQNKKDNMVIEVGASFDQSARTVRIWVKDNGVGIPEAHLPYIFKRFYRVESEQEDIKGTGLGLSIVKRSVEAHEGVIGVNSILGKETRFVMEFPAERVRMGTGGEVEGGSILLGTFPDQEEGKRDQP